MGEVKLIGTTQSFPCARIQWALKLKGVEYEFIEEDLRNKSLLLQKYNPVHKKVPVLVHREKPIAESLVILEYVDETWKDNPLLPQDPYDKAVARFWAKFADEKVLVAVWGAFSAEGEEKDKAIESALEPLAYLEQQIEGKKFFGGEKIGYLDLVVGWMSQWLNVMEEVGGMKLLEAERFPFLHEWGQNFIQAPAISECIPPREKLVEYFQFSLSYGEAGCYNSKLFCTRVQWALKLKGLEYEFIEEDLRNKSPILLKYNPVYKKVPVLVHHDTPIAESLVILEYIDETWKENPLLPHDSFDRAAARFWAKYADEKVVFGVWTACITEGEGKEKAIEAALESLAHLEKQIEGKKFFGGEQMGYLDLVLGWMPHWLTTMEEVGGMKLLEAERPCLLEWGQNFIHTPPTEQCLPPREKLIEYLGASVIYLRSLAAQKQ